MRSGALKQFMLKKVVKKWSKEAQESTPKKADSESNYVNPEVLKEETVKKIHRMDKLRCELLKDTMSKLV